MKIFLETARLVLRDFDPSDPADEALILALDSDPEVMRYLTDGAPTELQKIREWVLPRFTHFYSQSPKMGVFATHERATGAFVGWHHLRPAVADHPAGPETAGQIELGYRLKRMAWGKGYATEGSIALLDKAFAEHGAGVVMATTMKANLASRHVMEKLGMRLEREYVESRFPGADKSAVKYSIDREAWLASPLRARATWT